MSQHVYNPQTWVIAHESRSSLLHWILDTTPLGETRFGLRYAVRRRSTFLAAPSRVARTRERRQLDRVGCHSRD
jgi:hypothetical protein